MKPEELEERLFDMERVLIQQGKRLKKLEEQEKSSPPQVIQAHDYTNRFEELKELLKRHVPDTHYLKTYAQIASIHQAITTLPKVLPIRHHHHFEDRSRGFVIGGIVCLLTTAISVGLCFSLYRENSRMQENHTKYRMIRLAYPNTVQWVDSVFYQNPGEVERSIRLLEAEASNSKQQ